MIEDKPDCPYCLANGKESKNVIFLRDRKRWKCNNCGVRFDAGEVYEK